MRRSAYVLALMLTGCAAQSSQGTQPSAIPLPRSAQANGQRQSMKGFELYSWQNASGQYLYALIEGTNALPRLERVRGAAVTGFEALMQELRALKAGESVFWNFQLQVNALKDQHFSLPPADTVAQIRELARQQGLNLSVDSDNGTP